VIKIILYGDPADTSLTLPLCRALSNHGGALYVGVNCVSEYSVVSPEFFVFETDRLDSCGADKAILLFKTKSSLYRPKITPADSVAAVAEYEDAAAAEAAKKLSVPLVTCGMGSKNCVSVSSVDEKSAVIAVHRPITLLSGKDLLPCEFNVATQTKMSGYPLMALCATLILSEKFDGTGITM